MNENYFRQFKKSIDKNRNFSFHEKDWKTMEMRLDIADTSVNSVSTSFRWLVVLLIPLVLTPFFFFLNPEKNGITTQVLLNPAEAYYDSSQMGKQAPTLSATNLHTNIYESLIHLTTPIAHSAGRYDMGCISLSLFHRDSPPIDLLHRINPGFLVEKSRPIQNSLADLEKWSTDVTSTEPLTFKSNSNIADAQVVQKLPGISLLASKVISIGQSSPALSLTKTIMEDSIIRKVDQAAPSTWALELAGLGGIPLQSRLEKWKLSGISLGLSARFSKRWSWLVGVSQVQSTYQLPSFDPELGVPDIPPPDPDFSLQRADVRRSELQLYSGLRWQALHLKNWYVYTELKYVQNIHSSHSVAYSFKEDNQEEEEEVISQAVPDFEKNIAWLRGGLGLWFTMPSSHLQFGFSAQYSQSLQDSALSKHQIAMTANLKYVF